MLFSIKGWQHIYTHEESQTNFKPWALIKLSHFILRCISISIVVFVFFIPCEVSIPIESQGKNILSPI